MGLSSLFVRGLTQMTSETIISDSIWFLPLFFLANIRNLLWSVKKYCTFEFPVPNYNNCARSINKAFVLYRAYSCISIKSQLELIFKLMNDEYVEDIMNFLLLFFKFERQNLLKRKGSSHIDNVFCFCFTLWRVLNNCFIFKWFLDNLINNFKNIIH